MSKFRGNRQQQYRTQIELSISSKYNSKVINLHLMCIENVKYVIEFHHAPEIIVHLSD